MFNIDDRVYFRNDVERRCLWKVTELDVSGEGGYVEPVDINLVDSDRRLIRRLRGVYRMYFNVEEVTLAEPL